MAFIEGGVSNFLLVLSYLVTSTDPPYLIHNHYKLYLHLVICVLYCTFEYDV